MLRLCFFALVLLSLAPGQSRPAPAGSGVSSNARTASTLRAAAQHTGVLIGAAVRPQRLSEPAYAAILAREFNLAEAEDAMKWEVVHPSQEIYDFSLADRVVAFANEHQMKVRGHTLVWHRQNPIWLTSEPAAPDALSRLLQEHIGRVVRHFRGKVFAWDVVNEAFAEDGSGKLRSTIWYDQPGVGFRGRGTTYIEQCFRWAHGADPDALLFYNDNGAEEINPKSDAIYAMVRDFKRRGVPIHGVGFQMHIGNRNPDVASFSRNVARFTALGIQVHITEMDVRVPVDSRGHASPESLRRQAEVYREIVGACLSHRDCTAILMWGFSDKYSWIGSHTEHKAGAALPFDENYQPKPAYEALRKALQSGR